MRNIVNYDEYNECDFKPEREARRYMELVEKDVPAYFPAADAVAVDTCPACLGKQSAPTFSRFGMEYAECPDCGSLYVTARPDDESLRRFYRESEARKYWRKGLASASRDKRLEKIVTPRFHWIEDSVREYSPGASHLAVLNTDGPILIKQLLKIAGFERHTLLDPLCELKPPNGVDVVEGDSSLDGDVDVLTLFEVADRVSDVSDLFERAQRLLKPRGLCFLTGILASGFDILTLWEHADNVIPPDRLNVFTVKGLKVLFDRHGFEVLEFSTPGVLDVEIVASAIAENPAMPVSRFVRRLVLERNHLERMAFQEFLQANLLSSYGRVLLRKK